MSGGLRAGERGSRPAFKERFDVTSAISDAGSHFYVGKIVSTGAAPDVQGLRGYSESLGNLLGIE